MPTFVPCRLPIDHRITDADGNQMSGIRAFFRAFVRVSYYGNKHVVYDTYIEGNLDDVYTDGQQTYIMAENPVTAPIEPYHTRMYGGRLVPTTGVSVFLDKSVVGPIFTSKDRLVAPTGILTGSAEELKLFKCTPSTVLQTPRSFFIENEGVITCDYNELNSLSDSILGAHIVLECHDNSTSKQVHKFWNATISKAGSAGPVVIRRWGKCGNKGSSTASKTEYRYRAIRDLHTTIKKKLEGGYKPVYKVTASEAKVIVISPVAAVLSSLPASGRAIIRV
jgi:predicted DNA-binding WGR domain protein